MQSRVEHKHLQSQTLVTYPSPAELVHCWGGCPLLSLFCVVYNNLLINEHLSQLKCCGCSKINVCHQGGGLDQRQWNKRRVLVQASVT